MGQFTPRRDIAPEGRYFFRATLVAFLGRYGVEYDLPHLAPRRGVVPTGLVELGSGYPRPAPWATILRPYGTSAANATKVICSLKLGILTSVDTRHRYFARRLCAELDVVAIGYEQTGYSPASVEQFDLSESELRIVEAHFAERARQELRFFGADSEFVTPDDACAVAQLSAGALNTDATLAFLTSARVDTVAVFGTNLIKPPLLSRWPGRMVNMHLGLSPYYRGTATNFYPLLNEEPEFVGVTIHLLDAGIDAGPILKHARPKIVADDMPHTIGCKAIGAGINAMIAVLRELDQGTIAPVPQWEVPNPRLYLRKDYHPRQVVELYEKLDGGLIPRYVEQAADRSKRVRLVE